VGAIYQILIVAICIWGIIRGYRVGFTGQVGAILGIAFGSWTAGLFGGDVGDFLLKEVSLIQSFDSPEYTAQIVGSSICYGATFLLLTAVCAPLSKILSVLGTGIVNSLTGAIVGLFKYAMLISILYNIIVGLDNDSVLLQYGSQGDGNLAEATMLLAPTLLGCQGFSDLSYQIQLKEASKISFNLNKNKTLES
jgi:membrane protein required for colicin V production